MASVISILNYKTQVERPILILAGLHESDFSELERNSLSDVLSNCGNALEAARSAKIPVGLVRRVSPPPSVSEPQSYPAWLKGFEPRRNDMIFDVVQPSCYSNAEFCRTMDYSNGNFAIAGLSAEITCLSTAVDAHHRRQGFTYLADASACRNHGAVEPRAFHDAVSQLVSLYGQVSESAAWSVSLSLNRRTK